MSRAVRREARATMEARELLAGARMALSGAQDVGTWSRALVELAVPALSDWCVAELWGRERWPGEPDVDVPDVPDVPEREADDAEAAHLAVRHVDPARERDLRASYRSEAAAISRAAREALARGDAFVRHAPGEAALGRRTARRRVGIASVIVVPIRAGAQTFGTLTFGGLDDDDAWLAIELAGRLADALAQRRLGVLLSRAQARRQDLIRMLSHELRTPMSTVVFIASKLQEIGDDATSTDAEVILRSLRRMEQTLKEVLELVQLEAGELQPSVETLSLSDLLGVVVEEARARSADRHIELSVDERPTGESAAISCDAARVRQVVRHLLDQAIKQTDRGVPICAKARRVGDVLHVAVHGGVAPTSDAPGRAPSGSERSGGRRRLSLGLTLARDLIEALGGRLTIADRPEGGAGFGFSLPLTADLDGR